MGSLSRLDAEFGDFTVYGGVGDHHGFAAHRAVFDVGLLGNRQVEGQVDGLPAMRAAGVLALKQVHPPILDIMAMRRHSAPAPRFRETGHAMRGTSVTLCRDSVTSTPTPLYLEAGLRGINTRNHGADRYFET